MRQYLHILLAFSLTFLLHAAHAQDRNFHNQSDGESVNLIDKLEAIPLKASTTFQKIENHQVLFLEDKEEILLVKDIDQQVFQPVVFKNPLEISKKGFNYWLVFKLVNTSDAEAIWWLDVPGNYTTVWINRADGQQEVFSTGNLVSKAKRPIPGKFRNDSYVPLNISARDTALVKLKVRTNSFYPLYANGVSIGLPIYFKNLQNEQLVSKSYSDGLYGAVLLIFCLYCLGFFVFTKETFAFWGVFLGLASLGFFYHFNNTWYRLGLSPVFVLQAGMSLIHFSLLFDFLFARSYLDLKKLSPLWDKIYLSGIYYVAALIIAHGCYYHFSEQYIKSVNLLAIGHGVFYIPHLLLGVKLWTLRKPLTSIYAFGLISLYVILIYSLIKNGPLSNSTYEYLKVGNIFYVVSIMISFSYRAAASQKNKIKAEAEKLRDAITLEEQQKLMEELKNLDTTKSRFFANVSHELRTPLTLILGPIGSVLKSGEMSNRNFTHLKKAQQNGKELLKLVASILDLSKMESGKLELHEKPEMLFPLVRRISSAFESHAQRSGIEFTFDYQAEKDLQLQLDREKVETILNNLLSNAIKFTPSGENISIKTEDIGNAIRLSVADTGRGIHPGDLPDVFNRFYQSSQPDAPTEGGTGIGLALCQELTKMMGGKIWVESSLETGSTFFVELPRREVLGVRQSSVRQFDSQPVAEAPVLAPKPTDNQAIQPSSNQATILIVEDNHSLRDYIQSILSPFYNTITAENGQAALKALCPSVESSTVPGQGTDKAVELPTANCQLIVSDIMMPVMDGFQLLEKLKSDDRYRHLPVVMLTARADMQDRLRALRIGVDDYLLKPFEEEELLVRLENLLNNHDSRKAFLEENNGRVEGMPAVSQADQEWLRTFEASLKKQLANTGYSIAGMTTDFAMSESSLSRQLKRLTGLTPSRYFQELRLNEARRLLENRAFNTVTQVAYKVGFSDAASFNRAFKRRFGTSPSGLANT